jgi:hypothetical protein
MSLSRQLLPEHADVERERAFKVRDLEVDVTDVNTWIDW